jgi:hypothetical protein
MFTLPTVILAILICYHFPLYLADRQRFLGARGCCSCMCADWWNACVSWCGGCCGMSRRKLPNRTADPDSTDTQTQPPDKTPDIFAYEKHRELNTMITWKLVVFAIFCLYPYVVSIVLAFFVCREVNGTDYLVQDFTVLVRVLLTHFVSFFISPNTQYNRKS